MLMGSIKVFYKLDYKPDSKVYALTYSNITETQILVLNNGWNLVSFYVDLDFTDLISNTEILEIKNGDTVIIQQIRVFASLTNETFTLESGYWLRSNGDATITISGVLVSSIDIALTTGWNQISFPFSGETDLSIILNESYGSKILEIKTMTLSYNSLVPYFATLTKLTGGQGYWLKAESDFNLIIQPQGQVPSDNDSDGGISGRKWG